MPITPLPTPGVTPPNWGQQLNDAIESRYQDLQDQIDLITASDVETVNGIGPTAGNVALDAGDIPNTPAGGISATDVQAALNELDTDKANSSDAILKSIVDAKGDLIAATANDTVARVAVGTNGQVLTADSGQTAGVRWTTSRYLEGTGSPEGVITAGVGSRYVDSNATNGAVEWIKFSGTGNTGWRVVYGDTGRRALVSWDSGGTVTGTLGSNFAPRSGQAGAIYVRRVNQNVFVEIINMQSSAAGFSAGEYDLVDLSNGFGVSTDDRVPFFASNSSPYAIRYSTGTQRLQMNAPSVAGSTTIVGATVSQCVFLAKSSTPWPTSLPGVAA